MAKKQPGKGKGKGKATEEAVKDTAALKKTRGAKALPKKESDKGVDVAAFNAAHEEFLKKQKAKGDKNVSTAVALRPDVLPPASAEEAMLKHPEDEQRLHDIELCIERSLAQSKKLGMASTFTWVVTGIALNAAKDIMRRGCYEQWVNTRFSGFCKRQAQYICKLSDAFLRETGGSVQLPAPKEMGAWMVRADQEDSCVTAAIKQFVGDMTMVDLLDKYRIKPKKDKGGNRPGAYLLALYQQENPHLQNKPFEVWSEKDVEAFMVWRKQELNDDPGAASREAAEGMWTSIRDLLTKQGITRKSYALLTKDALSELSRVLGLVKGNLDDALKTIGAK